MKVGPTLPVKGLGFEEVLEELGRIADVPLMAMCGIELGLGHADLGRLRGGLALRAADVRAAAQQVGRDADGHVGRRRRDAARARAWPAALPAGCRAGCTAGCWFAAG